MAFLLRWLKRLGLAFLALLVILAIGRPIQIWIDGFYSGERAPYLQMPAPHAMSIRWHSKQSYPGQVFYGENINALNKFSTEKQATKEHEIRLSKLKPATKYYYRISRADKAIYQGRDYYFVTSPQPGQSRPVRLWITGDQGNANQIQADVRNAMLDWVKQHPLAGKKTYQPDLWITLGDNAYRSGTNDQFQKGFFEPYRNILINTPVWPGYGNHDDRRWAFFDIFTLPTKAESGGVPSATEHYYSFDYANVHVVMLDSQASNLDRDGDMARWLEKDLFTASRAANIEKGPQKWLLVISHHPPYTKGSHDSDSERDSRGRMVELRENIVPILEKYGADILFSGHSHMYERSELMNCYYGYSDSFNKSYIRQYGGKAHRYSKHAPVISSYNGTLYTVAGSSSNENQGPLNHPAMPYTSADAGSVIVDISGNSLKSYFINRRGKVIDQFTLVKGDKTGVATKSCK